jgi:pimeloyl-ACP methyl ester carboxylesterase
MITVLRTTRALGSWITGRSAVEEYETVLPRGDREVPASVTLPSGGGRNLPGWVVLHGVTRPGRFHPTLLRFVRALASSKAAVLVPQIPEWVDLRLEPERTLPSVRAALDGLRSLPNTSDGPYGLIGFSFGAPQVVVAATHQDVSDQLAGVIGFGGYCDIESMIRFQMTGRFTWGDAQHHLRPDPYGRWIMGGNHLTSIPDYENAQDVSDALWRLAVEAGERRILAWDPSYDTLKEQLREQVSRDRRELFDLFAPPSDREPAEAEAERITPLLTRATMEAAPLLDPLPFLNRVEIPVQLIHGRNDRVIPYTETLRMEAALPDKTRVDTTITSLMEHSEQGGRLASLRKEISESAKLLRTLGRLLGTV